MNTFCNSVRHGPVDEGFKLVELLVVIGIIAIWATLLFPALSRAKASARSAKCKTSLRQLGVGQRMYIDDHDNAYPQSLSANWPWSSWPPSINPYLKQPLG